MIERRNIAVCIVLTLVTCGIYGIYWIVCLTNDVNTVSGDVNGTSGGMVVLLTIVTCGIYGIYWMLKLNDEINLLRERSLTLQRITVESRQATAVFCI